MYYSYVWYFLYCLITTNLFLFQVSISIRNYTISEIIILGFWLVHTYNYLKDRRIDVITMFCFSIVKQKGFQVAMRLFSNWQQKMSKWGKNMFLPCLGITCNQLLNRRTAKRIDNRQFFQIKSMFSFALFNSNFGTERTFVHYSPNNDYDCV